MSLTTGVVTLETLEIITGYRPLTRPIYDILSGTTHQIRGFLLKWTPSSLHLWYTGRMEPPVTLYLFLHKLLHYSYLTAKEIK